MQIQLHIDEEEQVDVCLSADGSLSRDVSFEQLSSGRQLLLKQAAPIQKFNPETSYDAHSAASATPAQSTSA